MKKNILSQGVQVPRSLRASLLVGTALGTVVGIMALGSGPALAACTLTTAGTVAPTPDVFTCTAATVGPANLTSPVYDSTVNFDAGATIASATNGISVTTTDSNGLNPVIIFNMTHTDNTINALAGDGVTLTLANDNGTVTATGIAGDITAAGGNGITVVNTGFNVATVTISTTADSHINTNRDGINVNIAGGGSIDVKNSGVIDADSSAIDLTMAGAGTAAATNNAGGVLNSFTADPTVTVTTNAGSALVSNSGTINNSGGGDAVVVQTNSGSANFNNQVGGIILANGGDGVQMATNSGAINASNNGTIGSNIEPTGGHGFNITNAGPGITSVTGSGTIFSNGDGIRIRGGAANDGTITVNYTGNITTFGGNSDPIDVRTDGVANISITSSGVLTGNDSGIVGISDGGNVTIVNGGHIDITTTNVSSFGIIGATSGTGAVHITSNAAIDPPAFGIVGLALFGPVTIDVGPVTTANVDAFIGGVTALNVGSIDGLGNININIGNNSNITGGVYGIGAFSLLGDINVTGGVAGAGTVTGGLVGIAAVAGGNVSINVDDVNAPGIAGVGGVGVFAASFGDGNVSVTVDNVVSNETGIIAISDFLGSGVDGGNVSVTANNITSTNGRGITAETEGGGSMTILTTGTVSSFGDGIHTEADAGPTLITAGPITSAVGDGIDATAFDNGNITVHANGAITANGTGIQTDSDGGDITVTTAAAAKISAGGLAGISAITNGDGAISITQNGAIDPPVFGILALNTFGQITINSNANILALVGGIAAANIGVDGATGIQINLNNPAGSINGGVFGIGAFSLLGDINITGGTNAPTINGGLVGVAAVAGGAVSVNVNDVTSPGILGVGGVGIFAASFGDGNVSVTAHNVVSNETGIIAISDLGGSGVDGGNVSVTANNITSTNGRGITAETEGGGSMTVHTTGTILSSGDGIHTEADAGPTLITAGPITSTSGDGIDATAFDNGNITVIANGAITAAGTGIQTDSDGGDITITTVAVAKISAGGLAGISAITNSDGAISITQNGAIDPPVFGILALNTFGQITINSNANILALVGGIAAANIGVDGATGIQINLNNPAGLINGGVFGIGAFSLLGDVNITGGTNAPTINGGLFGVGAVAGGAVSVSVNDVTSPGILGVGGVGIFAASLGDGNVSVTARDVVSNETGIFARSDLGGGADGGNVSVTARNIDSTNGRGIDAETEGGGNMTVNVSGTVNSFGDGIHTEVDAGVTNITAVAINSNVGDGIDATAWDNGNITVNANGPITAGGTGIQTDSDGGDITVTTAAAAKISAGGLAGISAITNGDGAITITQNGAIDPPVFGILALNTFGQITINSNANILALVGGIAAANQIVVDSNANIVADIGCINAANIGLDGANGITINLNNPTGSINGGVFGIGAFSLLGDVSILGGAAAPTINGGLFGVGAVAGGAVTVNVSDVTAPGILGVGGVGIFAASLGDGNVSVTARDVVSNETGIFARSDLGGGADAGNVSVTARNIDSTNGRGIDAETEGGGNMTVNVSGTVNSFGDGIHTEVDAGVTNITAVAINSNVGDGIDATAWDNGNITVHANGAITAGGTGIQTDSDGGNITIITADAASITAGGNAGISAITNDAGNIIITTGTGKISADDGLAGILAVAEDGNITITQNGAIDPPLFGILAIGGVNQIVINSNANIVADIGGIAAFNIGLDGANGIAVNLNNPGGTITGGVFGVGALSLLGDVSILGGANSPLITGGTVGVAGIAGGAVTINVNDVVAPGLFGVGGIGILGLSLGEGNVSITARDVIANDTGIFARSGLLGPGDDGGNITITARDVTGTNGRGIDAETEGGGNMTVNVRDVVSNGDGIHTEVDNGVTSITVRNITSDAGDGIDARAWGPGNIGINVTGSIDSNADSIFGRSDGGHITVTTAADQTLNSRTGRGISLETENAGTILVNSNATVTSEGDAIHTETDNGATTVNVNAALISRSGDGVDARAWVNGPITINANADITAGDDGIFALGLGTGNIHITQAAETTIRAGDDGIQAFANAGNVVVDVNGKIIATGPVSFGVLAASIDGNATINVSYSGNIDPTFGALAFSANAVATVNNSGSIDGDIIGAGALSINGTAIINNNVGALISSDAGGLGAGVASINGNATLNNWSLIRGGLAVAGFAGNDLTINNRNNYGTYFDFGVIRHNNGQADELSVLGISGNNTRLNNDGELYGRVFLTAGNSVRVDNTGNWFTSGNNRLGFGSADQLNNSGLIVTGGAQVGDEFLNNCWTYPGSSSFGCALSTQADNGFQAGATAFRFDGNINDVVNNTGVIIVNGLTQFTGLTPGLENFNNAGGLISMINGVTSRNGQFTAGFTSFGLFGALGTAGSAVGDVTIIDGNFTGGLVPGASRLWSDAFLKGPNSTSASDLLVIGGNVQGITSIRVNDLNTGPGAYNPIGIPLVYVQLGVTNAGNFTLDPASSHYNPAFGGIIDKGLFIYNLALVQANPFDPFCGAVPNPAVFCQAWVLKSDPGITTRQLPVALTAAQNIWYESALLWEDRQTEVRARYLYGMSAGADLAVKAMPAPQRTAVADTSVWIKLLGSWTNRRTETPVVFNNLPPVDLDLGYTQDTYGFIAGVSGGTERIFSGFDAISVSLMGGYLDSRVKFNDAGTSFKFSGGTLGAGASYMSGGFFVDALLKGDFLDLSFDTPQLAHAGLPGLPSANVYTFGGIGNIGYRFNMGRFFMEPIGTVAYAKTTIDNFTTLNTLGANIQWGEGDSLRIAGGSRFGFALPWRGTHRLEGSVTLRIWDEVLGDNNTAILTGGGNPDLVLSDNFKKSFGEIKGGIDVISLGSGWSGFVNAGVKFNEEQDTVSAKGGLNYRWDWH